MADRLEYSNPNRLPPFQLALLPPILLAGLSFLPRVSANPRLVASFWGAAGILLVFLFLLRRHVLRAGRKLHYEFVPARVHYIQALMQSCIYVYWGKYWSPVSQQAPLVLAQLVFLYGLDMLVCWWRRDKWVLGFGPFPIILSTNLFLWYKDDWFFLQFLMVAVGVLFKEFVKWKREGRLTHIFNPSAIALSLFSLGLLITKTTSITWGEEIATTLHRPPHIYLEIFLVGLVVQALFSVTLVTLWAAAALCILNLVYTHSTGTYHFIDSMIPVSVFLGLHLLVTDPATSPRTSLGKILFGASYGAAVFAMYGALSWLGAPTFYDKLLCVPVLNLCVQFLDRVSHALSKRLQVFNSDWAWNPQRFNVAHMAVWISLFAVITTTGFLSKGKDHPGSNPAFWRQACAEGRWNGCKTWVHTLNISCADDVAPACLTLGQVLSEGRIAPRDVSEANKGFGRACDLGLPDGCTSLMESVRADGGNALLQACNRRDGASCFILGSLVHKGFGVPQDAGRSVRLFGQSCANGWPRGCGRLGESYLWGEGTAVDQTKAIESFEKACSGHHAVSCFNVAMMYHRGMGGVKDEALAQQRFRQACELGLRPGCERPESGAAPTPVADP
jgi:Sel1 repeat-containing protein